MILLKLIINKTIKSVARKCKIVKRNDVATEISGLLQAIGNVSCKTFSSVDVIADDTQQFFW